MDNPIGDVARLLQKMRLERGWSCEELAQKAGLAGDVVLAYEADPESLSARTALQVIKVMPRDPVDEALSRLRSPSSPPQSLLDRMESRMHEMEAALHINERRFQEALERLDRALWLSRNDAEGKGRVLLSRAAVLGELGQAEKASEALREAERCLDPVQTPTLWLRLRLEQLYLLSQTERYREARAWQAETLKLAARVGSEREHLQARYLSGVIAAGLNETAKASRILKPLRGELKAAGCLFEAADAALSLAGLLAAQGKQTALAELARELEPLIEEKKLAQAARSTLKVFCWAVRRGNLDPERARKLAVEFRRAGSHLARPYLLPV